MEIDVELLDPAEREPEPDGAADREPEPDAAAEEDMMRGRYTASERRVSVMWGDEWRY